MILKLELYLEVDTKEPQVTKQIYQEVLTQGLQDVLDIDQSTLDDLYSYKGISSIHGYFHEENHAFWILSEQLRKFGWNLKSKGVHILDIGQVAEKMRVGIKKRK